MSKNISNLSGRIGLKDNLFKQISENTLSKEPKDIKEIAKNIILEFQLFMELNRFTNF